MQLETFPTLKSGERHSALDSVDVNRVSLGISGKKS